MTELRTLKDIHFWLGKKFNDFPDIAERIAKKDIKQEAIKWVNEGLTEKKNSGTINWIKHFFNITEEELKHAP